MYWLNVSGSLLNSIRKNYAELMRQKYSKNDCKSIPLLELERTEAIKKAIDSSTWKFRQLGIEDVIQEYTFWYRMNVCDWKNKNAENKVLQNIVDQKSKTYEAEIGKQTEKSNKTVLFVSAVIMLIGGFLILKK